MQLLGLRGRDTYLDTQIVAAFESLVDASVADGYSAQAAEGRNIMLQAALEEVQQQMTEVTTHIFTANSNIGAGRYVSWTMG